ncbi:UDP-2,4-diacetamido-2,4,6-trideoxy-beta-L-altropyranose hydrolase [Rhodocytophaga rosea]|uniref:UDP-2,4-diacetamido-2,4, 6-trideoxy-beta-L-altropyranose hydrolase n=1 Tax=Rhodocytophaga rosea TaxID=2704465 RepID=A0A6C0GLD5_9BACT|nr:UDP-2,4-diacetamido-2,4,6-trideoxy-beta-L-altropyranose hydrolase [Rhodocytophaga rosea]QHT68825.1 UDP-2,4-diacetamido-2,4,6-trideoxy-beta-L-altropyranose hydrolase [Rhodocytophaga rosea]
MEKIRIVFRADGGTQIGLGHISRCLAIAGRLKQNFNISFAIQEPGPQLVTLLKDVCAHIIPLPPGDDYQKDAKQFAEHLHANDIVVLDGYSFDSTYQLFCKKHSSKVIYIDDLHTMHMYADGVINHCGDISPELYDGQNYTRYFLGTAYAILREPFLQATAMKRTINEIDTLFINMGGADIHNYSLQIIRHCATISSIRQIYLLTGSANPHLASLKNYIESADNQKITLLYNLQAGEVCDYMLKSQVAICASSVIAYEACCAGVGLILYKTASNQNDIYRFLTQKKLGIGVESLELLPENIEEFVAYPQLIAAQINLQKKYFDGNSLVRIEEIFYSLVND